MPCVIKNWLVLLRNYVESSLLNQFDSLYINVCFPSLNIFEENEFYEIKKRNIQLSYCVTKVV